MGNRPRRPPLQPEGHTVNPIEHAAAILARFRMFGYVTPAELALISNAAVYTEASALLPAQANPVRTAHTLDRVTGEPIGPRITSAYERLNRGEAARRANDAGNFLNGRGRFASMSRPGTSQAAAIHRGKPWR